MRTVLNGICLFIDNVKPSDIIFISNGDGEEESRIAERQRERVCVRETAHCRKGETALVIRRNTCGKIM